MEIDIIQKNEEAYYKKYGISLRERLHYATEHGDISDAMIAFYDDQFKKSTKLCKLLDASCGAQKLIWLLCGFADGTYVRFFLEHIPPATKILLYEPDEASFLYCCCIKDISDIIKNNSLCIIVYDENNQNCLDDALKRAFAYVEAGADGIMIHSRKKDPAEILEFCDLFRAQNKETPIVVVPSSFNTITEAELAEHGVNIVIYANQLTRSAYPAMKQTAEDILKYHRAAEVDSRLMPIKDIISLIEEI